MKKILLCAVALWGCGVEPAPPVVVVAKVVGSGCSAFGCVTTAKVTSAHHFTGETCTLNGTSISAGETVLLQITAWSDGGRTCRLR